MVRVSVRIWPITCWPSAKDKLRASRAQPIEARREAVLAWDAAGTFHFSHCTFGHLMSRRNPSGRELQPVAASPRETRSQRALVLPPPGCNPEVISHSPSSPGAGCHARLPELLQCPNGSCASGTSSCPAKGSAAQVHEITPMCWVASTDSLPWSLLGSGGTCNSQEALQPGCLFCLGTPKIAVCGRPFEEKEVVSKKRHTHITVCAGILPRAPNNPCHI